MIQGTFTALITPFESSQPNAPVDFNALSNLIEWQLQSGISGFVACGTTAETPTLTDEEKIQIIKHVITVVRGRVPVFAGTGTNNTHHSIELTREAKRLGADAALVVSPYYNKPTQEGLFQHFSAIADQGGLPVIVYDVPGRTSVEVSVDTFRKLSTVKNIVAIKECAGAAGKFVDLAAMLPSTVSLLAGDDDLVSYVMSLGGRGTISASANVIPKEMSAIVEAGLRKDQDGCAAAQFKALPVIRALFLEPNPVPAKAALNLLGQISNDSVRQPLLSARPETRSAIAKALNLR